MNIPGSVDRSYEQKLQQKRRSVVFDWLRAGILLRVLLLLRVKANKLIYSPHTLLSDF